MPSGDAQRRLPPIFPTQQVLFSGRHLAYDDLLAIDTLVGTHGPMAGYLVSEGRQEALYLLFLKGKPYAAGLARDGALESLSLRDYFSRLLRSDQADQTFDLLAVDPAVLLLIAVHFQKRPVLSVTADLASPEEVLGKVEDAGRDAVVAIVDGALRHVVFCKAGVPARFHPADEVSVPDEDSLAEAITVFCFERSGGQPVTLEIYDDLAVSPAPDHGLPLARYAAQGGQVLRYELSVFEGNELLETRTVESPRYVIGRGDGADLRLVDSAVSREHAVIEWKRGSLQIRDLDSDNGTRVNNLPLVEPRFLHSGDEVRLGRVRLVYRTASQAGGGDDETQHLDGSALGPRVVFLGEHHPVPEGGLLIGSDRGAEVRVTGWLVRSRQARIARGQDGLYWIEHLGGWRRLRVNGKATSRQVLRTGDAIAVGRETMRFYDAD